MRLSNIRTINLANSTSVCGGSTSNINWVVEKERREAADLTEAPVRDFPGGMVNENGIYGEESFTSKEQTVDTIKYRLCWE